MDKNNENANDQYISRIVSIWMWQNSRTRPRETFGASHTFGVEYKSLSKHIGKWRVSHLRHPKRPRDLCVRVCLRRPLYAGEALKPQSPAAHWGDTPPDPPSVAGKEVYRGCVMYMCYHPHTLRA